MACHGAIVRYRRPCSTEAASVPRSVVSTDEFVPGDHRLWCANKPPADGEIMHKAVVSLNTGLEDAETVTVAFLVAVGAAEQGRQALMFLTKEAVRLATDGFARAVACDGCPPLADWWTGTPGPAAGSWCARSACRPATSAHPGSWPTPSPAAPRPYGNGSATTRS